MSFADLRIVIDIRGMGGIINNHLVIIKDALIKNGIPVEVVNDSPEKYDGTNGIHNEQDHLDWLKERAKTGTPIPVIINMHHQPWGG